MFKKLDYEMSTKTSQITTAKPVPPFKQKLLIVGIVAKTWQNLGKIMKS
jgi:hypothetical protein